MDVPAEMIGDKLRFEQVLMNLLSNSVNCTYSGSIQIFSQYDKVNKKVFVIVNDSGIGIKLNDQVKIH